MYDVNSKCADDFINHEEILETLAYADENKENIELIDSIIEKAKKRKGLSHREASVLLACPIEEKNQEIYKLAEQIKILSKRTVVSVIDIESIRDSILETLEAGFGHRLDNHTRFGCSRLRRMAASAAWRDDDTLEVVAHLYESPYRLRFLIRREGERLTFERNANLLFFGLAEWPLLHGRLQR